MMRMIAIAILCVCVLGGVCDGNEEGGVVREKGERKVEGAGN